MKNLCARVCDVEYTNPMHLRYNLQMLFLVLLMGSSRSAPAAKQSDYVMPASIAATAAGTALAIYAYYRLDPYGMQRQLLMYGGAAVGLAGAAGGVYEMSNTSPTKADAEDGDDDVRIVPRRRRVTPPVRPPVDRRFSPAERPAEEAPRWPGGSSTSSEPEVGGIPESPSGSDEEGGELAGGLVMPNGSRDLRIQQAPMGDAAAAVPPASGARRVVGGRPGAGQRRARSQGSRRAGNQPTAQSMRGAPGGAAHLPQAPGGSSRLPMPAAVRAGPSAGLGQAGMVGIGAGPVQPPRDLEAMAWADAAPTPGAMGDFGGRSLAGGLAMPRMQQNLDTVYRLDDDQVGSSDQAGIVLLDAHMRQQGWEDANDDLPPQPDGQAGPAQLAQVHHMDPLAPLEEIDETEEHRPPQDPVPTRQFRVRPL